MYIDELKRELNGRQLEIWLGVSGLGSHIEERYRNKWRAEAGRLDLVKAVPSTMPSVKKKGCGCGGKKKR